MRTKEKKSRVKMNDVITTMGEIVASAGCRIILYQPKVPRKLAKLDNKKKN